MDTCSTKSALRTDVINIKGMESQESRKMNWNEREHCQRNFSGVFIWKKVNWWKKIWTLQIGGTQSNAL